MRPALSPSPAVNVPDGNGKVLAVVNRALEALGSLSGYFVWGIVGRLHRSYFLRFNVLQRSHCLRL